MPGAFVVPSQDLHALVSVWNGLLQFLDGNRLNGFDEFCIEKVEKLRREVEEHRPAILTTNIMRFKLNFLWILRFTFANKLFWCNFFLFLRQIIQSAQAVTSYLSINLEGIRWHNLMLQNTDVRALPLASPITGWTAKTTIANIYNPKRRSLQKKKRSFHLYQHAKS